MTELDAARIEDFAQKLVAGYRQPPVPAELFRNVSFEEAVAIQGRVLSLIGEDVPVVKATVNAEKRPVAAPIIASLVIPSGGRLPYPPYRIGGLEVEVAVKLKADLTPEIAARGEDAILSTIEHFLVGIEIIASRFDDRAVAGLYGSLADNFVTGGYIVGDTIATSDGLNVDGLPVEILIDGKSVYSAPAKHPLGGALNVLSAYGQAQADQFGGLTAGRIVTTGSLCGLVAIPGPGKISARLGTAAVEFTLG